MDMIDDIKVHTVVALGEELRRLDPNDNRYADVLARLDHTWRSLSSTEQDEVDRILGQRGAARATRRLHIVPPGDDTDAA